ncbi:TetR/AcrR family transcriptional regulator [Actinoplanes awajinensis]|uniref:TetR family transcriptional regulator n=1 Tax=Actinoplanes awajinensis subsp. mycoplanecinus TaxID=135947 RepID=A0A101JG56_9ACTN|nr:TetR/AcrR family transcriptional regulator [Actinoplanes awajinensis]KUL26284.1 TetR family transcriptional regulator [Actinoplanes awajinensis subsp. mycoplanecinus]
MARAGITADRLVEAAAELADTAGFDQVSLSALARHFGVAVPSLYAHVKSSHDLKTRIALLALAELADRGMAALAGRSGRDALAALGDVYRDYARAHPGRYAAARLPLDPQTAAASAGPRHSEMLRAVLRGYEVPAAEQNHAVRFLGATFHGYVSLELAGGFAHSSPDSQQSWSRAVDALDVALRHWPS